MCRLVVSMEEKFEASLKHEKEQLEIAYKEKLKDAELYEKMAMSRSGLPDFLVQHTKTDKMYQITIKNTKRP
jgi:hypothetical protein